MAASNTFDAVNNFSTRFHTQRINRRLDDRDACIKEAIATLEEKSSSYYPTVERIVFGGGAYSNSNFTGSNTDTTVTIAGTQLGKTNIDPSTGGDSVVIKLCGLSNTDTVTFFKSISTAAANAETSLAFTIDLSVVHGSDGLNATPAAGEMHLLQIYVNECLATEFYLTVGA